MTNDRTQHADVLNSLEVLRFGAAAMVVLAHLPPLNHGWLQYLVGAQHFVGSIGVDIFFVVSGVVMGLAVARAQDTGVRAACLFLAARFFRIFPLYLLATVAALVVGDLAGRPLPAMQQLACSATLMPCLVDGRYPDPVIGAGWTLRYEIYFYALTALGILVGWLWLPVAVILTSLVVHPAWLDYYAQPIALEFAAGYVLAGLVPRLIGAGARASWATQWGWLIVSLGLVAWAGMGKDFPLDGPDLARVPRMLIHWGDDLVLPRAGSWGVAAVVMTICCLFLERRAPTWGSRLGRLTYSIYLLEYFFLPVAGRLMKWGVSADVSIGFTVAILLSAAWLSYRYLEQPINTWWRRKARALN